MSDQDQRDRYTRVGQAFLAKAAQRLATIDPATISPGELARWVEVALKLEEAGARGGTYDRAARLRGITQEEADPGGMPAVVRSDPGLGA